MISIRLSFLLTFILLSYQESPFCLAACFLLMQLTDSLPGELRICLGDLLISRGVPGSTA